MNLLPWTRRYIGVPYAKKGRSMDGADCWGLVRIVLDEQFGIAVPSYSDLYDGSEDVKAWSKAIINNQHTFFEKVSFSLDRFCETGAVVLLHRRMVPLHVGYFIGTEYGRHFILHTTKERGSSYRASLEEDFLYDSDPTFYLPKALI